MTYEEQCFLDAILSDYRDTTSRFVFADWLDEHDRPRDAYAFRSLGPLTWTVDGLLSWLTPESKIYSCMNNQFEWYVGSLEGVNHSYDVAKACLYRALILGLFYLPSECILVQYNNETIDVLPIVDGSIRVIVPVGVSGFHARTRITNGVTSGQVIDIRVT